MCAMTCRARSVLIDGRAHRIFRVDVLAAGFELLDELPLFVLAGSANHRSVNSCDLLRAPTDGATAKRDWTGKQTRVLAPQYGRAREPCLCLNLRTSDDCGFVHTAAYLD